MSKGSIKLWPEAKILGIFSFEVAHKQTRYTKRRLKSMVVLDIAGLNTYATHTQINELKSHTNIFQFRFFL